MTAEMITNAVGFDGSGASVSRLKDEYVAASNAALFDSFKAITTGRTEASPSQAEIARHAWG